MNIMELSRLNNLLGQELGRRADGHPIFKWKNSDSLFWPAFATGRKALKRVEIPLLAPVDVLCPECDGGGMVSEPTSEADDLALCASCDGKGKVTKTSEVTEAAVPEYRQDRQMRSRDTWVVSKWLSAEELIWGWAGRHQEHPDVSKPTHERLLEMWQARFPGADFPAKGWRVPTDAILPRSPDGNREPNEADTRWFITCVKEQTRLNFEERLADMLLSEDLKGEAIRKQQEAEIRDAFPAMLHPNPGKRGNFVSFPGISKFLR